MNGEGSDRLRWRFNIYGKSNVYSFDQALLYELSLAEYPVHKLQKNVAFFVWTATWGIEVGDNLIKRAVSVDCVVRAKYKEGHLECNCTLKGCIFHLKCSLGQILAVDNLQEWNILTIDWHCTCKNSGVLIELLFLDFSVMKDI